MVIFDVALAAAALQWSRGTGSAVLEGAGLLFVGLSL